MIEIGPNLLTAIQWTVVSTSIMLVLRKIFL